MLTSHLAIVIRSVNAADDATNARLSRCAARMTPRSRAPSPPLACRMLTPLLIAHCQQSHDQSLRRQHPAPKQFPLPPAAASPRSASSAR